MDIVGKRRIFLIISGVLTLISIFLIVIFGFKLSIEFTGGSKLHVAPIDNKKIEISKLKSVVEKNKVKVVSIKKVTDKEIIIRTDTITDGKKNEILAAAKESGIELRETSFDTLGPVVGSESKINSLKAIGLAMLAITLYIAFAFRKVSRPVSSWKFGISAIIALIHDVVIVMGAFSLFGILFGVEIDTLFITAVLTIMGFSVHDTIVVFDRVRENLIKNVHNHSFENIVNQSFNETLARSLNTSITVVVVLLALIIFGGESIKWFIAAFLIGIITGTYSSIFIASAILVEWYKFDQKGIKISKYLIRLKRGKK